MGRKLIIFGIEKFAFRLKKLVEESGQYDVRAFCLDREYIPGGGNVRPGIVAFDEIEARCPPGDFDIMFAVGYKKMNTVRMDRMKTALGKGYRIAGYMHPTAVVQTEDVGLGNIFLENVTVGDHVKIGDGNIFYPLSHIAHDTVIGNYNFFTVSSVVAGNVHIGDLCVFGANSTTKNGVRIADATLVGAGSYIACDTAERSVYVPPRSYRLEGKDSFDMEI